MHAVSIINSSTGGSETPRQDWACPYSADRTDALGEMGQPIGSTPVEFTGSLGLVRGPRAAQPEGRGTRGVRLPGSTGHARGLLVRKARHNKGISPIEIFPAFSLSLQLTYIFALPVGKTSFYSTAWPGGSFNATEEKHQCRYALRSLRSDYTTNIFR